MINLPTFLGYQRHPNDSVVQGRNKASIPELWDSSRKIDLNAYCNIISIYTGHKCYGEPRAKWRVLVSRPVRHLPNIHRFLSGLTAETRIRTLPNGTLWFGRGPPKKTAHCIVSIIQLERVDSYLGKSDTATILSTGSIAQSEKGIPLDNPSYLMKFLSTMTRTPFPRSETTHIYRQIDIGHTNVT